MRFFIGRFAALLLFLSLACSVPQLLARKKDKPTSTVQGDQRRAVHALNRLTFGVRPGDVQQVMAMGVDKWIDLQIHPEKIKDDAVQSRLAPFRTLDMSSREMVEEFPDGQMIRAVMEGRRSMPSDPAKRAVFQVQIARVQERKERKAEAGSGNEAAPVANNNRVSENAGLPVKGPSADADTASTSAADAGSSTAANAANNSDAPANPDSAADNLTPPPSEMKSTPAEEAAARRREEHLYADLNVQQLLDLPPEQRYRRVLAMSTSEQVAFADSLRGGKAQQFLAGMEPKQKETLLAMDNPPAVVVEELVQAKLLRAIYSERQLEEVMADFWFNHFNVFSGKGADRFLLTSYEHDAIRPHALGKFEDLLVATAKSPAMLFYLDNWLSVGPQSAQAEGFPERRMRPYGPWGRRYPPRYPRPNANAKRKKNSGLNENYGRELLELHTLSVNGGYSQRDVTEVAKVFTGWTIDRPSEGGGFRFDPHMHEPGPKFVLGHRIKAKGEDEGREVLHLLATSPQTAHFISFKLAQRFVSDDPPQSLVDRMADTFSKKKGDIREVLTTLFHSPEFWAGETYRAKVKTPLEFVASAVRATGADVEDAFPVGRQLNTMGMPLFGAQPPTGYSMKADVWVSSSALLSRMNFAVALTSGKISGVKLDATQLPGSSTVPVDASAVLTAMEACLLAGDVSKQTHDSIVAQIEEVGKNAGPEKDRKARRTNPDQASSSDASTIAGLLLGSPEFQRR